MAAENLRILEPRRRERAPWKIAVAAIFGPRFRRITLFIGFLAYACLLFPRDPSFEVMTLREGYPAKRDLIAPFQFYLLKERAQYRAEQSIAARRVAPVYSVDAAVTASTKSLLDSLRAAAAEGSGLAPRIRALGLSPEATRTLSGVDARRILPIAIRLAGQAHAAGLIPEVESARLDTESPVAMVERDGMRLKTPWESLLDLNQLRDAAWDEGVRAFPGRPEAAQALQELVLATTQPNLHFEPSTTERLRSEAKTAVNPYDGLVRKDEKIIGSHEIATADHIRKLESLRAWGLHQKPAPDWKRDLPPVLGRLVLIAFLILGFATYLKLHHPGVYAETPPLFLLAVLSAVVMGVGWLVVNQFRGYEMLIPMTVLSLTVALLFGNALAFAATLVASLLTGVVFGLGLPFLTGSALAGIAAIATATGVRRRRDFYRPMLVVALTYAVAIAAMGLVDGARLDILARRMAWGMAAGLASVLAVTVLLPLLESLFTVTTDITLLELADLNRPILRRLMLEAPGTYHHSIVVGTLAESAAAAIGGNPLLARVGAYYHDIGKIDKAEYYVENQSSARNRHEKLSPTMSSLIIQAHVREGAEIARKEKLPKAIVDAILEHHGTTLLTFFYAKAQLELKKKGEQKKSGPADADVPEAEFRYPGPKPQSKETAVLMLADAVEAAARSLNEPTPGRIRGVVNRILEARVKDGQLDESPITFEDLAKIRDSFIPILTALFHARVHYPGVFAEEPRVVRPADDRGQSREGARLKIDNS
ncbi:MAG TPA: HDIG domain-containing protein [Candidatus Eisenbacteria bacterium]|nr:HDIG domain-containing protein [Candidatus Eisenbacteria bacterium]